MNVLKSAMVKTIFNPGFQESLSDILKRLIIRECESFLSESQQDCALQVAAMNPAYLNREAVPADALDKEREIMLAQMAEDPKMANKPDQVKHKIIDGKIGKYYSENCLPEQAFVKDDKVSVGKYVESVAKKLGGKIDVVEYVRFERSEGVEKKEENFADEVAAMTK